jgi:hypothetical protein
MTDGTKDHGNHHNGIIIPHDRLSQIALQELILGFRLRKHTIPLHAGFYSDHKKQACVYRFGRLSERMRMAKTSVCYVIPIILSRRNRGSIRDGEKSAGQSEMLYSSLCYPILEF